MLSIVIPAYNETENIHTTIAQLRQMLVRADVADFEFIVVDDHSSEPMYESLEALKASAAMSATGTSDGSPQPGDVHCIRLSRRSGSHVALRAGLAVARGQAVLCISADGQEDPAVVPEMLTRWREGAQVVWGLRRERSGESFAQKAFTSVFYRMLAFMAGSGQRCGIDLSRADFYLLDRQVVDALNSLRENNSSLFGLVAWIGYRQDAVEYDRRERMSGKSKWKFRSRLRLAKDWIIAFSGLPLKVMTVLGFGTAGVGLLYAVYIVLKAVLVGVTVPGWSSLMIAVLVLGGLQMAMLGVMGEYLWRTLEETRGRSLYFVEKSTFTGGPKGGQPPLDSPAEAYQPRTPLLF